ncbi:hypothetical protein GF362_03625 [Candidatus Dojkabacteria bacterium]|nr:hypothetical protein [Candidatus Dojkabacteria bacterium]
METFYIPSYSLQKQETQDILSKPNADQLGILANAKEKPLDPWSLNFYNELGWLTIREPDSCLENPLQQSLIRERKIDKKTQSWRHIGKPPNFIFWDKDLFPGDLALMTWSAGSGSPKIPFATAQILPSLQVESYERDILHAPLSELISMGLQGHEIYGDGGLDSMVEFYRRCYPERNIESESWFAVYPFQIESKLLNSRQLFSLYEQNR